MKKLTKLSVALVGASLVLLNIYYVKRHYNDLTENKILKEISSKYQRFPIQGFWIQKRNGKYSGCVTVLIKNKRYNHHFTADHNGHPVIID